MSGWREARWFEKFACWLAGHDWSVWYTLRGPLDARRACLRCAKIERGAV